MKEIMEKKSLGVIRILGKADEGERYTKMLRKKERREIAKFRLGTEMWRAPMDCYGNRECVLCGRVEGPLHWFNCEGTSEARSQRNVQNGFREYYGPVHMLKNLGKFLRETFEQVIRFTEVNS